MADFKLDFVTWDCPIEDGRVAEINTPDNPDEAGEVRQRAAIRIKTHLGELLFDTARGMPHVEQILVRDPNLSQITARARAELLTVEGVTGVRRLEIALDAATRSMQWTVDLETPSGTTGVFGVST